MCTTITISDFYDIKKIANKIPLDYMDVIETFYNEPQTPLIYTSFDGDYMQYVPTMQRYVYANKGIPINPEAALGYFVSTVTHNGQKVPVMMDCMRTELLCDEMWVFNPVSGHMPEGIVAELMIWDELATKNISLIDFFPDSITTFDISKVFPTIVWNHHEITEYLNTQRSDVELAELNARLLAPYKKLHLQNAYLIVNFSNYKHVDWARKYCYENGYSPVSSLTLLPLDMYTEMGMKKYLRDRLTLLSKVDNVFIFLNTNKLSMDMSNLDNFSLCELYFLLKYKPETKLRIIGWNEAAVPKYANSPEWALTTIERAEV